MKAVYMKSARIAAIAAVIALSTKGARADDAPPADAPGFGNAGPTAGVGYASTLGGGPSGWGYHAGGPQAGAEHVHSRQCAHGSGLGGLLHRPLSPARSPGGDRFWGAGCACWAF